MCNDLTPAQIQHRKEAFNQWLAANGEKLGYYMLPASKQGNVQYMLKKAFYAGSNYEAKMAC